MASCRPNLPLFLTDADVASLSDLAGAIASHPRRLQGPRRRGRHTREGSSPRQPREWLRIMPSVPPSGQLFGAKSIAGSFADGLRVSYLISLFDKDTADLVALVDGNRVTGLRTAATTAVGTSTIVPQRPLMVGVIGSGFEARSHLTAFSHLLAVRRHPCVQSHPCQPRGVCTRVRRHVSACPHELSARPARPRKARTSSCAPHAPATSRRRCWPNGSARTPRWSRSVPRPPHSASCPPSSSPAPRSSWWTAVDEVVHGSGDMIAARAHGVDVDSTHRLTQCGAARREPTSISSTGSASTSPPGPACRTSSLRRRW